MARGRCLRVKRLIRVSPYKIPTKLKFFLPAISWLFLFFLLPLLLIVVVSFASRGDYGGLEWRLGLQNYLRLFDPLYLPVFWRSLCLALSSTFVCIALAYPISIWMARVSKRWQGVLLLLVLIPFWTNVLIRLYAWMFILGRSGLFNSLGQSLGLWGEPLEILFTQKAIFIGLVYSELPFMVLPLYATLEKIDWNLVEAARDLYAGSAQVFWKVILPLSRPGLVAGSILVFVSILGDFVTPDLLGGAKNMMVGNLVQQQYLVVRDWPFGSALSLALMVLITVGIHFYLRQERTANVS
ncbi:MAG: ABC transporter permease [Elusimicrobia bacterium]|nr:ABC transporter permease [Elusimicrobiota bacterium]